MTLRVRSFPEVLLSVENISLAFGGVKALTDISFDIRKGEIRAIIGPNGAGKSSMLNCINGFYHPQQGSITYKGVRRSQMPSFARTVRCATGTAGRSVTVEISKACRIIARINGPSAIANPAPGQTRAPVENGI